MTTKNIIAAIALASVILSSASMFVPSAYAGHPLYTGYKHFWGNSDVCFIEFEFDNMQVEGSTNQGSKVTDETDDAVDDWNNSVNDFTFNKQQSCSKEIGARSLSGSTIGLTTYTTLFGYLNDVDFDFDTSGRDWQTGNTCTTDENSPNIELVATHELGHWIQFEDTWSGTQSHTVMWGTYNCNAMNVQSADATEVDNVY